MNIATVERLYIFFCSFIPCCFLLNLMSFFMIYFCPFSQSYNFSAAKCIKRPRRVAPNKKPIGRLAARTISAFKRGLPCWRCPRPEYHRASSAFAETSDIAAASLRDYRSRPLPRPDLLFRPLVLPFLLLRPVFPKLALNKCHALFQPMLAFHEHHRHFGIGNMIRLDPHIQQPLRKKTEDALVVFIVL